MQPTASPPPRYRVVILGAGRSLSGGSPSAMIKIDETFREPVTIEFHSIHESPTAVQLASQGYLRRTEGGRIKFRVTDKGRASGFRMAEFEEKIPIYVAAIAEFELVRIVDISDAPSRAATKQVTFTYRRAPNAVGRDLLAAGSSLRELHDDTLFNGNAQIARHEDGWRVQSLQLQLRASHGGDPVRRAG